jgi:hypothetical protein
MEVINEGILKALEMLGLSQPQQGGGVLSAVAGMPRPEGKPRVPSRITEDFQEFSPTTYDPIYAPRTGGKEVVTTAIDKVYDVLGDTNPIVKDLMDYTIQKESKYGNDPNTFNKRSVTVTSKSGREIQGTVGHGGVGQVTSGAFKNIVDTLKNAKRGSDANKVYEKLNNAGLFGNIERVSKGSNEDIESFLETPFNSVLMARLQYRINNKPLPKNKSGFKDYYEKVYRGY